MSRRFLHFALIVLTAQIANAQTDSTVIKAHPSYDSVTRMHRRLFGENFRKEWATPVKLPVIKLSERGLIPLQRGGGHQTHSLRLKDASGKEWVLRSIEKFPEILLPEAIRETFAADWVRDAMSAQHPYAPLIVPELSQVTNIPYASPIIGYVAPDKNLGEYEKEFANTMCLLEEREPYGNSDNTLKMLQRLNEDNDNTVDTIEFFKARLLDLFLGDWDRHEDQWRWVDEQKGEGRKYRAIPRDRDQALYRNEGFIPSLASRKWIAPFLWGFKPDIKRGNFFFFSSRKLNSRILIQLDHDRWMQLTHQFLALLTDDVLEKALAHLPQEVYVMRHDELLQKMKTRRANMPKAIEDYYYFLSRVVDIQVSDKNELVTVTNGPNKGMLVEIYKLSKKGKTGEQLFSRNFIPSETKELRFYIGNGDDSVLLNTTNKKIRMRLIGGDGAKVFHVQEAGKKVCVYEKETGSTFTGETGRLRTHLSNDTANTAFIATNNYRIVKPLLAAGFNLDDGLLLGAGLQIMLPGFRKLPFGSVQSFTIAHSFSTKAFRFRYRGEWFKAVGKTDLTLQATIFAPNNTRNFFGRGNETEFIKEGDYKRYYRTRYNLYELNPALRWRLSRFTTLSAGPSVQFYHSDSSDNNERFINKTAQINSYDSNTIHQDKAHAGVVLNLIRDKRDNIILPTRGHYINFLAQAYSGLNSESKSYVMLTPEIGLYKNLSRKGMVVISERLGGAVTFGKSAFYQSAFLGGHDNLLGFRQYRFAGEQMLYNNLEFRIKLANFASYILPGQFGMTGFYDVGRVWVKDESSNVWHQGVGGGLYFAPAQMAVFQVQVGYSNEGWYPYIRMGFRF
ncbi:MULTISPECIES: BamA/TamA family outer membrane protein [Niastella]|uniref:BamA/TamA family outer membrane protein n=1 Tax=Niastella soli TaxID=2821487 RepID=A0ABS3YRX7_9BACT|nr:BamA/TamA family outer membrane protein [Niastella soli]MBO9200672.1 BamA/TamA family outer membrane protein [Niastella soli]